MDRDLVFAAIIGERHYQDRMTARSDRPDMVEEMSMGDILTAMSVNLRRAEALWYSNAKPHQEAMEFVRKVAGLAVKAGEQFGMPFRPQDL